METPCSGTYHKAGMVLRSEGLDLIIKSLVMIKHAMLPENCFICLLFSAIRVNTACGKPFVCLCILTYFQVTGKSCSSGLFVGCCLTPSLTIV